METRTESRGQREVDARLVGAEPAWNEGKESKGRPSGDEYFEMSST